MMRKVKQPEKSVEEQRLSELAQKTIDRKAGQARISPLWIATEMMNELDRERKSPPEVYTAAHLHFRQVARQLLREQQSDPESELSEQHELWPELQKRYPAAYKPGEEREYIRPEEMTQADVDFNLQRMRRMSKTMQERADVLETWWKKQRRHRSKAKIA